jgi:hypothetical protein
MMARRLGVSKAAVVLAQFAGLLGIAALMTGLPLLSILGAGIMAFAAPSP